MSVRNPGVTAVYNSLGLPLGWVEIQRDDEAGVFDDDASAAASVSKAWRWCSEHNPKQSTRAWAEHLRDEQATALVLEWKGPLVCIVPLLDAVDAGATTEAEYTAAQEASAT